jgi:hypothetical protein
MAKSDYEKAIIKLLQGQRRPLTTRKISVKTDITWPTTRKYLKGLRKSGKVWRSSSGRKNYWGLVKVSSHKRRTKRGRVTRVKSYKRKKRKKKWQ